MLQPAREAGAGDLVVPVRQGLAAQGCEPDPFGEPLSIHFAAQHPELDQPDQVVFGAAGPQALAAEQGPVRARRQLGAAQGASLEFAVEAEPKGEAAHSLPGPAQGSLLLAAGGCCGHRGVSSAAIVLPNRSDRAVLLLASASPARRRLLEQAAIAHRVEVSGVDEAAISHADPTQLVQLLARAKAAAVCSRQVEAQPLLAVLGCDSVLVFAGEVFGKPIDPPEAIARWQRMAGGWGELHTGHCLLTPSSAGHVSGSELLATVTTRVQFAALSDAEIAAYVATGEPLQCAGGFALEGRGGALVERIEGCFSNVIGLSLPLLRRWLAMA